MRPYYWAAFLTLLIGGLMKTGKFLAACYVVYSVVTDVIIWFGALYYGLMQYFGA